MQKSKNQIKNHKYLKYFKNVRENVIMTSYKNKKKRENETFGINLCWLHLTFLSLEIASA